LAALTFAYADLSDPQDTYPGRQRAEAAGRTVQVPEEYEPALTTVRSGEYETGKPFWNDRHYSRERQIYRNPDTRPSIVSFYSEIIGSRRLAKIILKEAYLNEVPFSLAVALAYVESSFDPKAVNVNASSIDRGLFQLNNRSFPDLTQQEFFDPRTNAAAGLDYLRWCLEHGDNEIVALAMYNAGRRRVNERGAPKMTLTHISKIFSYRTHITEQFTASFGLFQAAGQRDISEERMAEAVDTRRPAD